MEGCGDAVWSGGGGDGDGDGDGGGCVGGFEVWMREERGIGDCGGVLRVRERVIVGV